MSVELRRATLNDANAVYALLCELKQKDFDRNAFLEGFAANLQNSRFYCQLALGEGQPLGLITLHLQFHLHHVNWIAEIQELVVMPQARGLGTGKQLLEWAEDEATRAGAEMIELSTSTGRLDAHRFYEREGYLPSHLRFTKALSEVS